MQKSKYFILTFLICSLLLISNNSYSQLSGTYTIGLGGNYPTIISAVNNLHSTGVSGPVVFEILNGGYDEVNIIHPFSGSSAVNTVTFKSQSGNPDSVLIYSNSNPNALTIDGADNLIFMNVTFTKLRNLPFTLVHNLFNITGSCSNIKILNNKFRSNITTLTEGWRYDVGVASSGASTTGLEISGNDFISYLGISMTETGLISYNTKIFNNTFLGYFAITLKNHYSLTVEKNRIIRRFSYTFRGVAISLDSCNGNLRVSKNQIGPQYPSDAGSHGIAISSFNGSSGLIANNMIYIVEGSGLEIAYCNNLNIYYNTIKCTEAESYASKITNSTGIRLRNNIFVQLGNNNILSLTYYISSVIFSDYNNLYSPSLPLLYFAPHGFINTLHEYQNLTGKDLHSVSTAVQFISFSDLHLRGSAIGNEALAGIPLAEVTDDIDGQPRDPFYPYMGADEADVVLPAELTSFTSYTDGRNLVLNWVTSTELNNSGFEIQRRNGSQTDWNVVGFVEGNGNSSSQNNYNFTDRNLFSGRYNYRLKQIDFNGSFEFYQLQQEVVIGVPHKYSLSQNYPNPFNPKTFIDYEIPEAGNVLLKIFDVSGKEIETLLNERKEAGYYSAEFNAANVSSGIYFYTMQSGNFVLTKKMTVIK